MTVLTPTQAKAAAASSFPDNTTGAITPAIMRSFQDDIIDSYAAGNFLGSITLNNGAFIIAPAEPGANVTVNGEFRMIDPPLGEQSLFGANHTDPTLRCVAFDSPGDVANRFSINGNGNIVWGPGSSAQDVSLLRASAGLIITDGGFKAASPSVGIGYFTGAGSTVAQTGSRTTAVSINAVSGAITLVSAAGSTTPATFTVNNTSVADTDTIILNQKSGTDQYHLLVTTVASTSFNITFYTTGGTTTETPVINFNVIKGVAA